MRTKTASAFGCCFGSRIHNCPFHKTRYRVSPRAHSAVRSRRGQCLHLGGNTARWRGHFASLARHRITTEHVMSVAGGKPWQVVWSIGKIDARVISAFASVHFGHGTVLFSREFRASLHNDPSSAYGAARVESVHSGPPNPYPVLGQDVSLADRSFRDGSFYSGARSQRMSLASQGLLQSPL